MKKVFLSIILVFASLAIAKDMKIVAQQFMPIAGGDADGKMAGVHYEIAKAACEKVKSKCSTELLVLARALEQIKTGDAHIILGIAKNAEREELAYFPGLLTQVGYTFFVKKGEASKYTKLEDFKGKTVGVHGGSATGKNLNELNEKVGKEIKIVEESAADTAPKKLAGGRYGEGAALYCARAVCAYQAKMEKLNIEPVSFDGLVQSHSFGVSKKSVTQAEFDALKKAVAEVMKSEKIRKLITENNLTIHPDYK